MSGGEEIRLGDVDPVDEFCVISIFDEAAQYLSGNSRIKLSTDQKLSFYGLFKQATIGPCDKPKPGLLEMVEKAKWGAWKKLGRMGKEEAIAEYVRLLDKVAPQWKEELGDMEEEDEKEEKERQKGEGGGGGGGGLQVSPIVSRPVQDVDDSSQVRDVCYFATQGHEGKVQAMLDGGVAVGYVNADGQTALMLAVDRGHEGMVELLLRRARAAGEEAVRELLSQQDADGMTALHYACVCDMAGCARLLLNAGADPQATNSDGESCWDCANAQLKAVLQQAVDKHKAA